MNHSFNEKATQLAINASYYEEKAAECWSLLNRIDDLVSTENLLLLVTCEGAETPISSLPLSLIDLPVFNEIFMSLCTYYRKKSVQARQGLATLKSMPGQL